MIKELRGIFISTQALGRSGVALNGVRPIYLDMRPSEGQRLRLIPLIFGLALR